MEEKIDFVVLWVDGNDPEFIREKNKYTPNSEQIDNDGDNLHRYRDYGTFNYWFRMVEKHAPWVNNIYLITNGQKPEWLNLNHPKLKWVKHSDFIPKEYLPTFNSASIELNLHRIEDLSENFVFFNDDMYLIQDVKPNDFFVNGQPKLLAVYEALVPWSSFSKVYFNNVEVLYRHFPNKKALKQSPLKFFNYKYGHLILKNLLLLPWGITGYYNQHTPVPIKKSTLTHLWDVEEDILFKHLNINLGIIIQILIIIYCVIGKLRVMSFYHLVRLLENQSQLPLLMSFLNYYRKIRQNYFVLMMIWR